MSYLRLTDLDYKDGNSTARWAISLSDCLRYPDCFTYRGRQWEVEIGYDFRFGDAVNTKVAYSVSPINCDVTSGAVNEYFRLSIIENWSNVKLWSVEKKIRFESPSISECIQPGSQCLQRGSRVWENILDRSLVNRLKFVKIGGYYEKKFSLVMEFLPFDEVDKSFVEDSQLISKQSEPKPTEVVSDNDWKGLSENILSLLLKDDDSDVTLNLSGRSFKAHRNILSAQSPVFDRMFKHDLKEKKTGTVDIPDCDPGAFEAYLRYLYSGNFDTITVENVCNLYRISDKYGSKTLVQRCLRFMKDNLSVDKFGEFVSVILNDLESSSFLEAAIRFFADNLEGIGESDAWKKFLEHKPFQANDLMIKAHKNFTSRHKK